MSTLFIVSKSPFVRKDAEFLASLAHCGDKILFIQDGVYAAQNPPAAASCAEFVFLREDCLARGINCEHLNTVDYHGFLELVENCERVA